MTHNQKANKGLIKPGCKKFGLDLSKKGDNHVSRGSSSTMTLGGFSGHTPVFLVEIESGGWGVLVNA